jgi:two-component system cell cycle sensor histidine kinase/response regulator CckA
MLRTPESDPFPRLGLLPPVNSSPLGAEGSLPEGISQDVFFRCVEHSNDAIMISDPRGRLVYVNPAWTRIYGYSQAEAIGQTPRLLHSGMHDPDFYSRMWASIQDPARQHWRGEVINRAKNGHLVPVLLSITPIRSTLISGQVEGYMGISYDLRQQKELEAKVMHQDRLASIGMLASGLAHEIGTPLGVVQGRAEMISFQTEDPAIHKSVEIIQKQTDRISKLIRSLLRMSRSFGDSRLEPILLRAQVEDTLALVGQHFRHDSVPVTLEIDESLQIDCDSGRLQQILLNLFLNAIHAIRRAIQEGRKDGHEFKLTAVPQPENGRVELRIEDSGCGISSEHQRKLFQPFFTTKDVGEGTGLGLAIVAQLVHELQATIRFQSRMGVGTTFTLSFPAEGKSQQPGD